MQFNPTSQISGERGEWYQHASQTTSYNPLNIVDEKREILAINDEEQD
jgi:hypothetical protein